MKRLFCLTALIAGFATAFPASAHNGTPSIHDTIASIVERLRGTYDAEGLEMLTRAQVLEFLTEQDRELLGTTKLMFTVNAPVTVHVIRDARLEADEPFWLGDRGFQKSELRVSVENREFEVFTKDFEAGPVGLGIDSLTGQGEAYFVALAPKTGGQVEVTDIYPAQHRTLPLEVGAEVYFDDGAEITQLPDSMRGMVLLQGSDDRVEDSRLVGGFRSTPYPASDRPDHLTLTWSGDPQTTQTIQWRTGPNVKTGKVAFMKKSRYESFWRGEPTVVDATSVPMVTPFIANDPRVVRHTVVLRDLEPDTTYVYAVGDGSEDGWTEMTEFTTAPDREVPFSFVYMGDAQNGLERWGSLIRNCYRHRPDAAFYVMAGDLVNRGAERWDWDTYFENGEPVFKKRQVVPCPGNHEYHGGNCDMYLDMFALPTNGCPEIQVEKSYAIEYSNALFVVLDSNLEPALQTEWLEEQLKNSDKTWKFVVYHHPAYSSGPGRDNPEIRELWGDLFDKYHVDLALQGHDHAYLRTYPMFDGKPVVSPKEGTIYIVSVSGTKYYDQGEFDYTEHGMTKVSTYQVLDILVSGDKLVYRAHDIDGQVRDEFVIEK